MISLTGPYYTGSVRWNGNTRSLEVMDQHGGWQQMYFNQDQPLMPPDAYELLEWARKERNRQDQIKHLREKYPTLDQALTHAEVITALVTDQK